jgi:taurine dioxygenase
METVVDSTEVIPLTAQAGVELRNVVFEKVAGTESFFEQMRYLLARHLLVFIPAQDIQPGTMTDFASHFGPLLDIRRPGSNARHVPGHDLIKVVSNIVDDEGRPLGDGNSSAQIWHSDSTPWEVPPSHIVFYCRQVPDPAPRTSFLSMVAAYEALPVATKERINDLRAIHHQYPRQIEVEIARTGASLPLEERQAGRVHPLVRRHMPTTAPVLFLPTRRDSLIVGWSEADSRALLEELWAHVEGMPGAISIALQPDDFVMWDNAAMVHSREGWPADEGRAMWHVSVEGEVPTPRYGIRELNVIGLTDEERRAQVFRFSDY